jgi:anti-sigma factor RsiW
MAMRKSPASADRSQPSPRELAELSALADGTLDPGRRDEVAERIAASPQLRALYEREQRVVRSLHAARQRDRAPASLRARIEATRPSARTRVRRRAGYGAGLAGALAVLVLALVLVLPAGTPGAPSLGQAAALGVLAPSAPAPPPDPDAPAVRLGRKVGPIYFPNWATRLHAPAIGERTDQIDGRLAVTVFYQWRGARVAYTIVATPALEQPAANGVLLNGTEFRTLRLHGRTVVTWRRDGRTCVVSAASVPASVLQTLAAWRAPGQLAAG